MRKIDDIILHCSDTPFGVDFHVSDIDLWHRERGFKSCGYHYVITLDGTIERGRSLSDVGAHCLGHNKHSIGICYIGGRDSKGNCSDTLNSSQRKSLLFLLDYLHSLFPKASFHGHCDYSSKKCPCFDVDDFMCSNFSWYF